MDRELQRDYRGHRYRYVVGNEVVVNSFEEKMKVMWVFGHQIVLKNIEGYSFIEYYDRV